MVAIKALEPISNDAEPDISILRPYTVAVEIEGTAPFLFHRWSVEAVAEKAKAAKGSAAKKSDNVESYVYRDAKGNLAIPGEYIRQSIINAAKYRQDPRSPRKSAMDIFKAGVVSLDELCSLGFKDWAYLDQRRVMIQRNGVTRQRPAIEAGWKITVHLLCNLPEYIPPSMLHSVLTDAGRLIGVGDFRPTYGRFQITSFHEA
jgi:hypothetical protein